MIVKIQEEGFVRFAAKKINRFDKMKLPEIAGKRWSSMIQYDKVRKHFRCLKMYGKSMSILDGGNIIVMK